MKLENLASATHDETMNKIIEIWKEHSYFSLGRFISNSLYGNFLEDISNEELLRGMEIYSGHLKLKQESQEIHEDKNPITDVHTRHCCKICGCKYGESDCTVVTGHLKQEFPHSERKCNHE